MTTDPIEQVALAFYKSAGIPWERVTPELRVLMMEKRIPAMWQALTEQGIPIEKLLSGEMKAVEPHKIMYGWEDEKETAGGQVVTPEDTQ